MEAADSLPRQFVDWEEQFISHDRGSRVVHYRLKDRNGSKSLAVIGTERSLRHMVYVVCDEFLPLAGLDKSNTPAFKWRSRREVVDWLTTFITRPLQSSPSSDHYVPKSIGHELSAVSNHDTASNGEDIEFGEAYSEDKSFIDIQNNKQYIVPAKEVVWVGAPWSCRKRLRHYQSFQRNGITISVNAFVYVMSEGREHHIAYIEDMYEDRKCKKKVRVRWFHKTDELIGPVPAPAPLAREVFITPFPQVLSVECVDGRATVLTPEHYEKCLLMLAPTALSQIHMCFRQFDNEGVKPFNIAEVKGYWLQEALTVIGSTVPPENMQNADPASDSMDICDEDTDIGNVIRRGPRAARSLRRRNGAAELPHGGCHGDISTTQYDVGRLTCNSPAEMGPGTDIGETKSSQFIEDLQQLLEVHDKIEVLCEDSGVRGCWFRCTVLQKNSCRMKVQYDELEAEDGCGKLEEWVLSTKVAVPDKLGLRALGRMTTRPSPVDVIPHACEVGAAVDAWWNDGWWEGIMTGSVDDGKVLVYFPDENDTCFFHMSELRISKDWVNGHWVEVKRYHDLREFTTARASRRSTSDKNPDNDVENLTFLSFSAGSDQLDLSLPYRLTMSAELRTQECDTKIGELETGEQDGRKEHVCKEAETSCVASLGGTCTEELESGTCVDKCLCLPIPVDVASSIVEDNRDLQKRTKAKQLEQIFRIKLEEDGFPEETVLPDESRSKLRRKRPSHQIDTQTSERTEKFLSTISEDSTAEMIANCSQGMDKDSGVLLSDSGKELNISRESDAIEDTRKAKKARSGHENTKSMLGPSSNGSLFINSVPLASLVMSR